MVVLLHTYSGVLNTWLACPGFLVFLGVLNHVLITELCSSIEHRRGFMLAWPLLFASMRCLFLIIPIYLIIPFIKNLTVRIVFGIVFGCVRHVFGIVFGKPVFGKLCSATTKLRTIMHLKCNHYIITIFLL